MAEIFGVAAGALSTAGLFNNCVDCFNYIQIARQFREDFPQYRLRLDVAKCRLARWGAAIDINNDPRFSHSESTDRTVALAQSILQEIVARFETVQKISSRYARDIEQSSMEVCTEADLGPVPRRLHNNFPALTIKRYNSVGLLKKTSWALYHKKHMGSLIDDIIASIEDLETTLPASPGAVSRLVEIEIEEVNDEQEFRMVQDVAEGLDPILYDLSKEKLQEITGKNSAGRISGSGAVNIGNTFVKESFLQSKGFKDHTTNYVNEVDTAETGRVNIVNTYGGKGFWD
ncbi:hypothetical protein V3481_007539 [Fusarium oxysporum f. sp. vasinfectum]|uniref:Prion-inhibition and propagation HeLo domain-containing protein n=1 Tax=Fusarium oxysporum f. sp. vasinfectum 25433 TaxID=1089449 RepID=X0L381_FUSOX|nr:hypothetical protein FOTG_11745 [Fusarium oxysporum f. sp. vasinfectum 25433]KAK2687478.1 hypothetical protein QWA68_013356 [Fusarium oxysporum]